MEARSHAAKLQSRLVPWCSLAQHAALSRPRSPVRIRSGPPHLTCTHGWRGGRARLKATVSKTVIGATLSWVRIPPSPPDSSSRGSTADLGCLSAWLSGPMRLTPIFRHQPAPGTASRSCWLSRATRQAPGDAKCASGAGPSMTAAGPTDSERLTRNLHWLQLAIELSRRCPRSATAFSIGAVIVDAEEHVIADGYSRDMDPQVRAENPRSPSSRW